MSTTQPTSEDRLAYYRLHSWMRRHYPRSGRCERCGQRKKTEFAQIWPGSGSRNWADWLELCHGCHNVFDGCVDRVERMVAARLAKVTDDCRKCGASDWYVRPNGVRQCRACQRAISKRYLEKKSSAA